MSEHYTGKLRAGRNGGFNQGPVNALFTAESDICGDLVASLNTIPISPTMEADARRLAACWNACDGISTESLEIWSACGHMGPTWEMMIKRLGAQRDELLTALQGLLPWLESAETKTLIGDEGCVWAVENVRAAIAKATVQQGGAA